jgi:hypothetical protein
MGRLRKCLQDWHDTQIGAGGSNREFEDASVPFQLDVPAMMYSDQTPM